MTEPNVRPYEGEITYDLPQYRELCKHNRFYFLRNSIYSLVFMGVVVVYCALFRHLGRSYLSLIALIMVSVHWGLRLLFHFLNRKGGKAFQRMLADNGGKPLHNKYAFLSDGIHGENTFTGGKTLFPYEQVRAAYESENLIAIILEHQRIIALEKRSLTGGPVGTFIEKLLQAAPKARKKRATSLLPGKIVEGITVAFSVICLIFCLWWSPPAQNVRQSSLSINDSMSYAQVAKELEAFGIHNIPESAFLELAAYDSEMAGYFPQWQANKCLSLLCWAGMPDYDPETWQEIPHQRGVYWFDMECYDLENMYTNLLNGIRALDPEVLNFENLREDTSQVNWDTGNGIQKLTFDWNGQTYTLTAKVDYDWYDISVLNDLNAIIRNHTGGKQLYFAWDQGQGFLVFFADAAWAREFSLATGITVRSNPVGLDAYYGY